MGWAVRIWAVGCDFGGVSGVWVGGGWIGFDWRDGCAGSGVGC